MINTGENKGTNYSELLTPNSITIITDVNSDNKEAVFNIFGNSLLYIDKKFDMPTTNNEIISGRSATLAKVNSKLTEINDEVINKKSKMFASESQFRNFKIKILFWCAEQFNSVIKALDNKEKCIVSIYNDLSKHEQLFVEWLASFGATFFIVSSETIIKDSAEFKINTIDLDTNEHIAFDKKNIGNITVNTSGCEYKSLQEIESALYEEDKVVKVIVKGTDNYDDTCNFYGKIYLESRKNNGLYLLTKGFEKPSYEQTSKIPRFTNNKLDYIITTLSNFVNVSDSDLCNKLKGAVKTEFNSNVHASLQPQQLYNKMVYSICVINSLFSNNDIKKLAYYGIPNNNDSTVLDILSHIESLAILVLCSDKNKNISVRNIKTLELQNSTEVFPIPMVDKRDGAFTMAAQAQGVVERTLFSGDTLGMYKPGQFKKCNIIPFNTTYDETKLWWNKEMYLRPGFEAHGDTVTIPTLFKVVKGVKEGSNYFEEMQQYCCGKTILCKDLNDLRGICSENYCKINHRTDVKGTGFNEQKPFYDRGKLVRDRIRNGVNFKYNLLEFHKQELIFNAIEDTINNDKIKKTSFSSDDAFIDAVLNLGLNIRIDVLQIVQWFEFYTYNPNVVLTITGMDVPNVQDMIILNIIQNLGFDVLIFVPTCYSTIENCAGNKFLYSIDTIGEAVYNVDSSRLYVSDNIEIPDETSEKPKKKGFFGWLFT